MALKRLSLVLLYFATLSNAYTVFETSCTAPLKEYNFVSSAENRGTLDILWTCLFTILACTWTIQHLNVQEQREGRNLGRLGDIKWALKRTCKSVKWMVITIFAPEIILGKSCGDLRNARHNDHAELERLAAEDGVPWTLTHTLFANMGGFVIRSCTATRHTRDLIELGAKEQRSLIEPSLAEAAVEATSSSSALYPNPFHLIASDILALRKANHLSTLPNMTKEDISDKSKCDSFGRLVAIFQILWMILQITIRAWKHLAISQLEISVVAFSICAIVIYGFSWEKPKNPETPITLQRYSETIPSHIIDIVKEGHNKRGAITMGMIDTLASLLGFIFKGNGSAYDQSMGSYRQNHLLVHSTIAEVFGCLLGCTIFGSIHLLAWDFSFPSVIEQTLWRAASVYCASAGLFYFLIMITIILVEERENIFWTPLHGFLIVVFVLALFMYIIARLFLIVETFRTLCFLPPDAYTGTFASNFPHVG